MRNFNISLPASSGLSQSLESVVSGHRLRSHTVSTVKVDQQGKLLHPVMAAHSMVMQKDPRRFSEASIGPPPRPPPPNLKRLNMKSQRRPVVHPIPGAPWPPHLVMPPAAQPQPHPHPHPSHQPLQSTGGSNLAKMAQMSRSNPQLDGCTDNRERERSREKLHHVQNTRDSLTSQVKQKLILTFLYKNFILDGLKYKIRCHLRLWRLCTELLLKRFILHFNATTGTQ